MADIDLAKIVRELNVTADEVVLVEAAVVAIVARRQATRAAADAKTAADARAAAAKAAAEARDRRMVPASCTHVGDEFIVEVSPGNSWTLRLSERRSDGKGNQTMKFWGPYHNVVVTVSDRHLFERTYDSWTDNGRKRCRPGYAHYPD